MPHDVPAPQEEPRTAQVNVRLTASEKLDVQLVAAMERIPESEVMRKYTVEQITTRADSIRGIQAA